MNVKVRVGAGIRFTVDLRIGVRVGVGVGESPEPMHAPDGVLPQAYVRAHAHAPYIYAHAQHAPDNLLHELAHVHVHVHMYMHRTICCTSWPMSAERKGAKPWSICEHGRRVRGYG